MQVMVAGQTYQIPMLNINFRSLGRVHAAVFFVVLYVLLSVNNAYAIPVFARQTSQNCVACHTGGQFPELTPYGRLFKLTGYTMGARTLPFAVTSVSSVSNVANTTKSDTAAAGVSTTNSNSDFYKNNEAIVGTASLFIAGKVTDNVGAFMQVTYDPFATANADGSSSGQTVADNMDVRFADRLISQKSDLIWGVSVNNSPSLTDVWNTAPAWMQYVPGASPGSYQFTDATAPYPGLAAGSNVAGVTAYAYLDQTWYGELGLYTTANGPARIFSEGAADNQITYLSGSNPYWRFAYTKAWDASNLMVGTVGMLANVYDGSTTPGDPNAYNQVRNLGVDTQYQYIFDPLTITVQAAYMQQSINYSANTLAAGAAYQFYLADGVTPVAPINPSDTYNTFRTKVAFTYRARYGGSFSYFNLTGTTNTLNQTSGYEAGGGVLSAANGGGSTRVNGNFTGSPDTSGVTLEAFYLPLQNLRLGVQYTIYDKYNGSSSNYDGLGRNASDNDTLYLYAWLAF